MTGAGNELCAVTGAGDELCAVTGAGDVVCIGVLSLLPTGGLPKALRFGCVGGSGSQVVCTY